jgi:competence protein ComEA
MDELISKMRAFLKQAGPSRKLISIILLITALSAFVINAVAAEPSKIEPKPTESTSHQAIELPTFYVHIVGQIKNPGVYSLAVGSRLFDAVVAAGGFLDSADQSSVNLARQLTDGEQILVLKAGDSNNDSSVSAGKASALISLNRASESELEGLPGVGPALAARIIDWRAANGGFKKKEDLLNVGGIGDKLFGGISKLVTL